MRKVNEIVWWLNGNDIICSSIAYIRINERDRVPFYALVGYMGKFSGNSLFSSMEELLKANNLPVTNEAR